MDGTVVQLSVKQSSLSRTNRQPTGLFQMRRSALYRGRPKRRGAGTSLWGFKDVSVSAGNLAGPGIPRWLDRRDPYRSCAVVFGSGVRYFGNYDESKLLLEDPDIVQGDRVTHLHYRVRK
jgi:hypothetical protein